MATLAANHVETDKFDAQVWLMASESRLTRYMDQKSDRLALLQLVYREAHRTELDGCTEIDLACTPFTNTLPIPEERQFDRLKVLSIAPLIGEAITRIHRGDSVGALFSSEMQRTQEMLLWAEDHEEPA